MKKTARFARLVAKRIQLRIRMDMIMLGFTFFLQGKVPSRYVLSKTVPG
jgi:Pyruvate/2-oxoacid:ferredoxin oxidoreductase gamma subunit